jgi:hypothetical protein
MCCQETACRECIETLMMKSENKELVIKGQFECSFCNSDHCSQEDYVKPVKLCPNKKFKKLIEENFQMPLIFCDSHPYQVASKFCRKHQCLICKDCLIEDHIDHSQDCKQVVGSNINQFFKRHQGILMSLNAEIIELNEGITSFIDHEK